MCGTTNLLLLAIEERFLTACLSCAQRLEADYKAVTDNEKAEVVQLGGLHVVGTERHVRPDKPTTCIFSLFPSNTLYAATG